MMPIQYTPQALAKLKKLRGEIDSLRDKAYFSPEVMAFLAAMSNIVEELFQYKTAVEISNAYDSTARMCQLEPSFLKDFKSNNAPYQDPYDCLTVRLDGLIKTIELGLDDTELNSANVKKEYNSGIDLIITRFHLVVKQLSERHKNRETVKIEDEYDVQDLFHALLRLYFDDVRPEEWTPSYAGKSSRIDFLLPELELAIEIKMTREGLNNKEVGEQLVIDKEYYRCHPTVKHLICFVYDPSGRIKNPRGFEKDIGQKAPLRTDVFVRP